MISYDVSHIAVASDCIRLYFYTSFNIKERSEEFFFL